MPLYMEDQATFDLAYGQIKELHKLCCGDNLTLAALKQKINTLDERDIENISHVLYHGLDPGEINGYDDTPFLYYACSNKNVTLEIIQYLLEEWATDLIDICPLHPEITAIHLLCSNEDCPDDVIRFLFEQHPEVFERMCLVDDGLYETYDETYASGLPIHYYLSRNKNVNIDTVKMLVEAYPRCLMTSCEGETSWPCYPIHALLYNQNVNNLQEILTYLIELEPSSVHMLDGNDSTPLHVVCGNKNVSLDIIRFICDKWPEAITLRDDPYEALPIHKLCHNEMVDGNESLDILQFMINIDPAMVRVDDEEASLPLHLSLSCKPFVFCKVLIDLYPESLKEATAMNGFLPIHLCCMSDTADKRDTLRYVLKIYPEGINVRDSFGQLPIHRAAAEGSVDLLEILLMLDPDAATREVSHQRTWHHRLPLHIACERNTLMEVQVLYDVYPDAIDKSDRQGKTPLDLARKKSPLRRDHLEGNGTDAVINFIQIQLAYSNQAQDTNVISTPDKDGRLPLHHALKDGAPLGSIKLLLRGNLSAIRVPDNKLVFPLQLACEFCSAKVVRYLIELDDTPINSLDINKDSILHYACRGAKLDVVQYLLTNHTSLVPSAMVNAQNDLPIHLLCEAGKDKVNCESSEYIETIWQMLLANPEALMS